MCSLLQVEMEAAEVEMETFRCDPLKYHYFRSGFKEFAEYKIDDTHCRLVRLLKFPEEEAKDTIKHCIQQ